MSKVQDKLDEYGIDAICAAILSPMPMKKIAEEIGVSQGSVIAWIGSNPERSARAREARAQTAQIWDEKATSVIEEAKDQFDLSKAKELAHHYRWRASKIAPREYGEKMQTEHSGSMTVVSAAEMGDDELAAIAAAGSR